MYFLNIVSIGPSKKKIHSLSPNSKKGVFVKHPTPQCVFKLPCLIYKILHWLHSFDFSPLCVFKCFLKLPASEDTKLQLLQLFAITPQCVFKLPCLIYKILHWLHSLGFSPLCVFECFLKLPA